MNIRTCEEYVLARLEALENENERLADEIVEQSLTIGRLVAKERDLNDTLDVLLGLFEKHEYEEHVWWASESVHTTDDLYEVIENLKKEREPNSEENDSQNNVSEL